MRGGRPKILGMHELVPNLFCVYESIPLERYREGTDQLRKPTKVSCQFPKVAGVQANGTLENSFISSMTPIGAP